MPHIIADRVKERIQSPAGTGTLSLLNTVSGYRRFSSVMSSGDTCYYCLESPSNGDWECGLGTYSSNNALSRTSVYSSSNSGTLVNFANRVSYAFISYVASRAIYLDPSGELNLALTTLSDVGLSAPASGESLVYNGSSWANTVITGYTTEEAQDAVGGILADTSSISFAYDDGTPSISASVRSSGVTNDMLATGIDATKLGSGSVSSTELGYLDGVTSSIQTQFGNKADTSVQVIAGTGLSGGGDLSTSRTLNLANTAVTPGSYTLSSFTVDAQGRITAASNGSVDLSSYATTSAVASGYQPLDADLTSLAAASGSGIYERSGGNWTPVVIGTGLSLAGGALSNTLDLSSYLTSSVATATYLPLAGGTLTGDLKFTDALYDIGKSGATRPRDGWFSRKLNVGSGASIVDNTASGWGYALLFDGTNSGVENGQGAGLGLILRGNTVCLASSNLRSLYGSSNLVLGQTDGPYAQVGGAGVASTDKSYNRITTHSSDGLHVFNHTLTSPAKLGVYETWTSSTSFGAFQVKANAGAAYQIGSAIGSAGGTNRDLSFGQWSSGGTFSTLLNISGASGGSTVRIATTSGAGTCGLEFGSTLSGWQMGQLKYTYDGLGGWGANFALVLNRASGPGDLTTPFTISSFGNTVFTQTAAGSGSPTAFTITGAGHTTLTASTEATDVNFNLARTVQFATGALTTQRAMRIQAPTYSFVGASTITTASTVAISGPPVAGTNATITNAYALNVESGNVRVGGNILFPASGAGSPHLCGEGSVNSVGWKFDSNRIFATYAGGTFFTLDLPDTHLLRDSIRFYTVYGGYTPVTVRHGSSPFVDMQKWEDSAGTLQSAITATGGFLTNDIVIRNATTATGLEVHGTWTSTTSYELINIKGKASANFEIGPENGSAGGTLRGLTLGCYPAGTSTIVGWAQFRPNTSTGALEAFYLGPIADSTATGGNARGTNAVDLQILRTGAGQVASGAGSFLAGRRGTASGGGSFCFGDDSAATGQFAVAIGCFANATAYGTLAIGINAAASGSQSICISNGNTGSSATAQDAIAVGNRALADRTGIVAIANGGFAANGDAQKVLVALRNKTTDATPVTLYSNGSSTRLTITSGKILYADVLISGIKSDGSAAACYKRKVAIKNVGGTTSLVGTVEAIGTDIEDNVLTDVVITADNTNDALDISVTGIAAETWRWVAVVEGLEIAYGT